MLTDPSGRDRTLGRLGLLLILGAQRKAYTRRPCPPGSQRDWCSLAWQRSERPSTGFIQSMRTLVPRTHQDKSVAGRVPRPLNESRYATEAATRPD
jgi:hypothetical protein